MPTPREIFNNYMKGLPTKERRSAELAVLLFIKMKEQTNDCQNPCEYPELCDECMGRAEARAEMAHDEWKEGFNS